MYDADIRRKEDGKTRSGKAMFIQPWIPNGNRSIPSRIFMVRFVVEWLKKVPDFRAIFGIFAELGILRNPPAALPGTGFAEDYVTKKN